MVRKAASEGPSLFCEWAVGSSINSAIRRFEKDRLEREKEAQRRREVIKVELTADEESETDSVRVTYPRKRRGRSKSATNGSPSGVKHVRFEQGPLKPALKRKTKKKHHRSRESDTLATDSGSETDARRGNSPLSRRSRSASPEDSEAVYDSTCSDCDRDLVKKKEKKKHRPRETRSIDKYTSEEESSTGSELVRQAKKDDRRKRSKKEHCRRHSRSHNDSPIDIDFDTDISDYDKKKSRREKGSKKHRSKGDSPRNDDRASPTARKSALSSKQKIYPEAMPGPHPRRPNLIRPIRAEVMQVEHTVEGPEDPRPNAFVDERNNIVRVYHGPAYGNPYGKLYPRRDPSLRPLPIGVPHPLDNPYYHGFRKTQKSPTGQMPTTLGDPYSSIPAHSGNDLTAGLWGIGPSSPNASKNKASSWSNNVGPPKPSASLREGNPSSRWNFSASKNVNARNFGENKNDGGDGSVNGSWGETSNTPWGGANNDGTGGGGDNNWISGANEFNAKNGGDTNDWMQENNDTTGSNTWGVSDNNQGTSGWDNGGNTGGAAGNQSPAKWDDGAQGNGNTWAAPDPDNGSASNNVGFAPPENQPGPQNDSWAQDHRVPGEWQQTSPEKDLPPWADLTAAQSTQNQGASRNVQW